MRPEGVPRIRQARLEVDHSLVVEGGEDAIQAVPSVEQLTDQRPDLPGPRMLGIPPDQLSAGVVPPGGNILEPVWGYVSTGRAPPVLQGGGNFLVAITDEVPFELGEQGPHGDHG